MDIIEKLFGYGRFLAMGVVALLALYFAVPAAVPFFDKATTPKVETKPVGVEASKTALLVFDFSDSDCAETDRALCAASRAKLEKLVADAQMKGAQILRYGVSDKDRELPADELKAKGIVTVLIAGGQKNGALVTHAVAASEHGFSVVFISDTMAVATSTPEGKAAFAVGYAFGLQKTATFTRTDLLTLD